MWRSIGNDSYSKISGTILNITTENPISIYEYGNFSPIPFQAGDIFGIFQPVDGLNSLDVLSEKDTGPTNYYIVTSNSATESPIEIFDLQDTQVKMHNGYLLVTVEISKYILYNYNSIIIVIFHFYS